jgi:toxin YoeB
MAKKIIWSSQAQKDRYKILQYWIKRNKSKSYSNRLNKLFIKAIEVIAEFPEIGKPTNIENVKGKVVRDYYIFYEMVGKKLHILTIWDSRQDPAKLKERIKKG